jgi:hypothetical protein
LKSAVGSGLNEFCLELDGFYFCLFRTIGESFVLFLYSSNNFIMAGSGNEEGTRTEQDQQISSSEAGEANTQATQQTSSDPSSASGSENQSRRSIE